MAYAFKGAENAWGDKIIWNNEVVEYLSSKFNSVEKRRFRVLFNPLFLESKFVEFDGVPFALLGIGEQLRLTFAKVDEAKMTPILRKIINWELFSEHDYPRRYYLKLYLGNSCNIIFDTGVKNGVMDWLDGFNYNYDNYELKCSFCAPNSEYTLTPNPTPKRELKHKVTPFRESGMVFWNKDVVKYLSSKFNSVKPRFNVLFEYDLEDLTIVSLDNVIFAIRAFRSELHLSFAEVDKFKMLPIFHEIENWKPFAEAGKYRYSLDIYGDISYGKVFDSVFAESNPILCAKSAYESSNCSCTVLWTSYNRKISTLKQHDGDRTKRNDTSWR